MEQERHKREYQLKIAAAQSSIKENATTVTAVQHTATTGAVETKQTTAATATSVHIEPARPIVPGARGQSFGGRGRGRHSSNLKTVKAFKPSEARAIVTSTDSTAPASSVNQSNAKHGLPPN